MAAALPLFSTLFDDWTKWDEPDPTYESLITLLVGGAVRLFIMHEERLAMRGDGEF